MTCYSATKTFVSFVAEALNTEFEKEIDFICYHSAQVDTNMQRGKSGSRFISAKRAAESSLRDIGCGRITNGALRHEINKAILPLVPVKMI
jgi:short-subunit dehydrogenase